MHEISSNNSISNDSAFEKEKDFEVCLNAFRQVCAISKNELPSIKSLCESLNNEENQPYATSKTYGIVTGCTASTFINCKLNSEDKICISLNVTMKIKETDESNIDNSITLPNINIFGLYDSYSGDVCSTKLKSCLHKYIVADEIFLIKTADSLVNSFKKADEEIINHSNAISSSSFALVCLIINNHCYIASLGLSRALMSVGLGSDIFQLSKDHTIENEMERIINSGGECYEEENIKKIKPGGATCARMIGTIEGKTKNITSSQLYSPIPDVLQFTVASDYDFIILASDSICSALSNFQMIYTVYDTLREISESNLCLKLTAERIYQTIVRALFKTSIEKGATGNLSCVIIFFENFTNIFLDPAKRKLNLPTTFNRLKCLSIASNLELLLCNNKEKIIKYKCFNGVNGKKDQLKASQSGSIVINNIKNINNINNNFNIQSQTKIYWCCCRRKKRKKSVMSSSIGNIAIQGENEEEDKSKSSSHISGSVNSNDFNKK